MPRALRIAALTATCLAFADASAHHSPAMFDLESSITIEGVVARYHWTNPHVYIDLEVVGDDGEPQIWEIEAAWPASLVPTGWGRETLTAGDAVAVTGNPGKNATRRMVLGRSLRKDAGVTLLLNVEPGTPASDTRLMASDRSGLPAAEALLGGWLPLRSTALALFAPSPLLTAKARTALPDRLDFNTDPEAARCMPHRPPFNMSWQEAKSFERRGDDLVIRVAVDADLERIVHMNPDAAEPATRGRQGHSSGRFERDALIVETSFDDDTNGGIIAGVPWSRSTRLIERFELSEDRKRLTYTYAVENPEYLAGPFTQSAEWAYRPDLEIPRLGCDPEIARRFLE